MQLKPLGEIIKMGNVEATQSESALEAALLSQLGNMAYERVMINNSTTMLANLKKQLESFNHIHLSDAEFNQVLHHLNRGDVSERAEILRNDACLIKRHNEQDIYVHFLNKQDWCANEFQVAHQVRNNDSRENRYDVTILINGLPLVQIELKKRGLALAEAFHQIERYKRDSYDGGFGLFQYVQLFIISNGVNTKYFSNNKKLNFEFSFYWADEDNKRPEGLAEFADAFLKPCHIAKMITQYTIVGSDKVLRVMRPYQVYAVERMIEQVKNSNDNAYIWHTTGSGKTLTAFKASQIINNVAGVEKVLFVVDRKDLDSQTTKEFNDFQEGSVDVTQNTRNLIEKLTNPHTKLIVTTLQKLNNAITRARFKDEISDLANKKVVFIFDECHRSQFGDTHKNIVAFFKQAQLFGFTGTPIFDDNANKLRGITKTTKDLFGKCLHKYTIVNAIHDGNVLRFSVEYVGKYHRNENNPNELDIDNSDLDTKEILESEKRAEAIARYILQHHDQKTANRKYVAMMCVSNVSMAIRYYELFKRLQQETEDAKKLKIATIFSYAANEEARFSGNAADGSIAEESTETPSAANIDKTAQDKLEEFMQDYNKMFQTNYSANTSQGDDSFYGYYKNISEKTKNGELDILLVVNMFLTGFSSNPLNTLYVDKNLKTHGLIQAFSRTNRIHDKQKAFGNIVCFRDLKESTDEAIALFSNNDATNSTTENAADSVLCASYQENVSKFNVVTAELRDLAAVPADVDALISESDQLAFVLKFRELMRLMNAIESFAEHKPENLAMDAQTYLDYRSKYLDIRDHTKQQQKEDTSSLLDEIDFETDLIQADTIDVDYILNLLKGYNQLPTDEQGAKKKAILSLLNSTVQLRNKAKFFEDFIDTQLPAILDDHDILEEFQRFFEDKRQSSLLQLCNHYNLNIIKVDTFLRNQLMQRSEIRNSQVADMLTKPLSIRGRTQKLDKISTKLEAYIDTFYDSVE